MQWDHMSLKTHIFVNECLSRYLSVLRAEVGAPIFLVFLIVSGGKKILKWMNLFVISIFFYLWLILLLYPFIKCIAFLFHYLAIRHYYYCYYYYYCIIINYSIFEKRVQKRKGRRDLMFSQSEQNCMSDVLCRVWTNHKEVLKFWPFCLWSCK